MLKQALGLSVNMKAVYKQNADQLMRCEIDKVGVYEVKDGFSRSRPL